MNSAASSASDLSQQFQQAAERVSNLPPSVAGPAMHALYGLYKQATDGDHDTFRGEVGREDHDNPDGPAGLSQAQWDSWSQFKGMSQDEAMRRYVETADQLGGLSGFDGPAGAHGKGDGPAPADDAAEGEEDEEDDDDAEDEEDIEDEDGEDIDEPSFSQAQPTGQSPTRTAAAATGPGTSADPTPSGTEASAANAGLRGDLRAGAPYGSEEERKEDADAQRGSVAQPDSTITES